jgi:long-chain acyl-CoA synthetase
MMVEVLSTSPTATRPRSAGDVSDAPATGTYGRVAAWLSKRVEVALADLDLTLPQYRVLGVLAEGTAAASFLADRLAVRRPSVTAIIDGLVARGFVERTHEDNDRRRIALTLTDDGARIIAEADRSVDTYLASIATCLPGKDEAMALRSLELWGQALTTFHQERHSAAAEPDAQ